MTSLLDLWDDPQPHDAAWNMAADEVLLRHATRPLLRVYRWSRPAVSIGYFFRLPADAPDSTGSREFVRRWTGGGRVLHGDDFTYSLIVPRAAPESLFSPVESYRWIHGHLCAALCDAGHAAVLVAPAPQSSPADAARDAECFQAPVASDVLVAGRKVAGAGQRRSRHGLLHQGSVQGVALPENFAAVLASRLAEEARLTAEKDFKEYEEEIEALAREKYATEAWLHRA